MIFIIPLIFVTFFYEFFLSGKSLFLGDNLLVIVPHKIFILESLKKGVLPLWNPHMWAGFPEVGDITLGLFNPFNVIHFIFPDMQGATIAALVAYFIAFCGTYVFLRHEKLKKTSSLFGAIIFTFSGSMMNISADIIRIESICLLPWTLLFVKRKHFLTTIILLSLNFLVGQTQHFYMLIIFISGYLIFTQKNKIRHLVFFYSCIIFSILLSAFALLPQLELIKYSSRSAGDFTYNTIWSLHPASIIRFIFADFWGRQNSELHWGPNVTYSFGYIGFFTLFIIIFLCRPLNRRKAFFLLTAFLSFFIALGKFNPFYRLFFLIPAFSFFRNPSSWLILYSFAGACYAALILESIDFDKYSAAKRKIKFVSFLLTGVGLLLLLLYIYYPSTPNLLVTNLFKLFGKTSAFHTIDNDKLITFFIGRNLLILGLLSLLLAYRFKKIVFIFIVFLDLLIFSKSDLLTGPGKFSNILQTTSKSKPVQYLTKNLGNYRFISIAEFLPYRGISHIDYRFFQQENFENYPDIVTLLSPNIQIAYNLSSINGYSSFYIKDFKNYFSKPSTKLWDKSEEIVKLKNKYFQIADPTRIDFDHIGLDDPRLAELSVKYVLSSEKKDMQNHDAIPIGKDFIIYKNNAVLPRAMVYNSNNHQKKDVPKLIDLNPNEVKVVLRGKFQKGDYLLLRDVYYPGWHSYNQYGQRLSLIKTGIFRKVILDRNTKSVLFKFEPESFYIGLKVSLVTLIVLSIIIVLRIVWRGKRNKIFFVEG